MDPVEKFLTHHGVKGMKWGVRRGRTAPSKAEDKVQTKTTRVSNGEAATNRILKAAGSVKSASKSEKASAGKSYAIKLLKQTGDQQVKRVASVLATMAVKKAIGI